MDVHFLGHPDAVRSIRSVAVPLRRPTRTRPVGRVRRQRFPGARRAVPARPELRVRDRRVTVHRPVV